ncbi:MAG: Transposase like protein [Bacteroidota bacterium]|nr:Transposase like protein [Bacteroidota bacterium]
MANTYTQLYIHCVFAVKYRAAMLQPEWDERLRLYITAIVQNHKHKMIAINNMPDHLHFFVGLSPNQSISDMLRFVKGDSSEWINSEKFTRRKFNWQDGYGAFSHSKSQVDSVVKYILNQKEHHEITTFLEEYRGMLEKFGIKYDERYIFKLPIEESSPDKSGQ